MIRSSVGLKLSQYERLAYFKKGLTKDQWDEDELESHQVSVPVRPGVVKFGGKMAAISGVMSGDFGGELGGTPEEPKPGPVR